MIKIKQYPACDECGYYLCSGDASAIFDNGTIAEVDATLGSIMRDDCTPDSFVLETPSNNHNRGYIKCTFCDDVHLGSMTVQIQQGYISPDILKPVNSKK